MLDGFLSTGCTVDIGSDSQWCPHCVHPPVAAQGLESTDWPQSAARNWSSPCRTSWFRLARTHFTPHPFRKERQACMNSWRCISTANSSPARANTQDVINPATLEVLGQLPHATEADLDRALAAAQRAFESWKKSSPMDRSAILRKGRPAVARARQGNRPQHDPGPGQAAGRGRGRSLVLRRARRLARRGMPPHLRPRDPAAQPGRAPDRGARAHRRVRCLHALELPYNQAIRKIAAALGAGCTVVLKGPEDSPSAVMAIARMFHEAGLPRAA